MSKFAVILPAAGQSRRFGDLFNKKVFASIDNKPLWLYAAEPFAKRREVAQILLVIAPEDKETFNEKFAGNAAMLGIAPVAGGATRALSVRNALEQVQADIDFVAIHDAARPCLAQPWIDAVFEAATRTGAAILAQPCSSTLKRVREDGTIEATVPRDRVWLAQTPQVFRADLLRDAYARAADPATATDEAALVEPLHPVTVVEGSPLNIKVTTKADLKFAELAMRALPKPKPFPFA
ncbi:MAG: 2-C-methyl-D-erythritol 4-phosphate cytidylyltransferase [Planctomycetota bacterium]|nr:MAG: 2-C-methyl-D-erythritol 4-phosphate cytidylyltransferase [Planctomycetota bacterium]